MKKILGRILVVVPAVSLQIIWCYVILGGLDKVMNGHLIDAISGIFTLLAVIFVLNLVSKRDESTYKILWIMVILVMPVLGALLYLFLGNKHTGRNLKKKLSKSADRFVVREHIKDKDQSEEIKISRPSLP